MKHAFYKEESFRRIYYKGKHGDGIEKIMCEFVLEFLDFKTKQKSLSEQRLEELKLFIIKNSRNPKKRFYLRTVPDSEEKEKEIMLSNTMTALRKKHRKKEVLNELEKCVLEKSKENSIFSVEERAESVIKFLEIKKRAPSQGRSAEKNEKKLFHPFRKIRDGVVVIEKSLNERFLKALENTVTESDESILKVISFIEENNRIPKAKKNVSAESRAEKNLYSAMNHALHGRAKTLKEKNLKKLKSKIKELGLSSGIFGDE